jgi:dephospho-CoA kinase
MLVIGITGTLGAGKGTIVKYLTSSKGFKHYSVRNFLVKELKKRNRKVNRDTMTSLANELRAAHSPSYITDKLYEKALQSKHDAVIESIRTPGEVLSLRDKSAFTLFAVDAMPEIRFKRILARKSETDAVSWETFCHNEKREMDSEDPNKQNLKKCIEMSDYLFQNNGSIEDLYLEVEKVLAKILRHGTKIRN